MFITLFIPKYLILKGGILSVCLLGWILVLVPAEGERGMFGERQGEFYSNHLSKPSCG